MAGPVSEMVATAIAALRRERNERVVESSTSSSSSDDDFTANTLYRRTISTFSPRRPALGSKRPRGRPTQTVKIRMFLLDKPTAVLPSPSYRKRLTEGGLGSPKAPSSNILKKCWSIQDLQNHIVSLYPGAPLELIGFHVGKSTKSRQVVRIEIQSVIQLKKEIGKGVMFIIPKSEISVSSEGNRENSSLSEDTLRLNPIQSSSTPLPTGSSPEETSEMPQARISSTLVDLPSPVAAQETDEPLPILSGQRGQRTAARHARRAIRLWCNRSNLASPDRHVDHAPSPHIDHAPSPDTDHVRIEEANRIQSSIPLDSDEDIVEIIDSEDEALQLALEASLQENGDDDLPARPLKEILEHFKQIVVSKYTGKTSIVVLRRKVLESTFLAMSRPAFNINANLYVKFSGEIGEDYGGPRREYFRLVLKELQESCLFEGGVGEKCFAHNLEALEDGKYQMAGQLVGMSLLQDGPGIHCLNSDLFDLMVGKELDLSLFNIDLLTDTDVREILLEFRRVDDNCKRDAFLVSHGQWLIENGITGAWRLKINEKEKVISKLVKQFIFYRCFAEISSFTSGINQIVGLWDLIKQNHTSFKELFCDVKKEITKDEFMQLYKINWSEEGSNRKMHEEETIYGWELFLQAVDEKEVDVTFEEILIFITGADHVPPLGFTNPIEIHFYIVEPGVKRLPFVSTCSLTLHLPREISDPNQLKNMLVTAFKDSKGFQKI